MIGLERRGAALLCDGVPLSEAAERFGTPLYLYSRESVAAAYAAYDRAFAPVPHRVCYALKANGSGALLRVLAGLGAGADVVSGLELKAALRAGFRPEHIVFSGVGKTDDELRLAVESEIGAVNAESEEELGRIDALASAAGRTVRVSFRVNPDIDPRSHPYISTGLRDNKFGVEIGRAEEILGEARRWPGLAIVGVQCHIGSQITDLEPVEQACRALVELSQRLLSRGLPLQTVDIGGGLGIDYEGSGAPDPAALARRVVPLLQPLPLQVLLEPGRSLLAPAGTLLTRVLSVKRNHGKTFVIVDAAMNDLLRPALYKAFHRIEPVLSRSRPSRRVDVVGPVCETGDFLARDRELEDVGAGELLAVRDVGAYGFCMSSTYNMRPRPAEVLVEDGALRLIRRRETFDDLIRTEL